MKNDPSVSWIVREWFRYENKLNDRMIEQLFNSVIAKYCDLSMPRRSVICLNLRLWQLIDMLATDKLQYFAQLHSMIVKWFAASYYVHKSTYLYIKEITSKTVFLQTACGANRWIQVYYVNTLKLCYKSRHSLEIKIIKCKELRELNF